jgi:hypothetical protein
MLRMVFKTNLAFDAVVSLTVERGRSNDAIDSDA